MRQSVIWRPQLPYEFDNEKNCWKFTHGAQVIKIKSWIELPSPPKPQGIQISVVIVNWNRPVDVVNSSIRSVLDQDFPAENFEVILVDDASDISPKDVCLKILKEYPNHNFRSYLLERTRCWSCMHAYNVGIKRAVGWIIMTLQSEAVLDDTPERDLDASYPKQPALEGVWRHHNAMDKLGLIPRRLNQVDKDRYTGWPYFPHDHGLSVRKCYAHLVRGYPEQSVGDPAVDYIANLTGRCGIKFTEDLNMQVVHRDFLVPKHLADYAYNVRSVAPGVLPSLNSWLSAQRPDWSSGQWGELTESEEKNAIRSQIYD
jgi:glycosyltransferase involved in cell wall biosynthesis